MNKIALIAESFISPILIRPLIEQKVPVYATSPLGDRVKSISRDEALGLLSKSQQPLVYTNAEDVLPLLLESRGNDNLKEGIRLFKDKVRLNQLLEGLEPGFFSIELRKEE